MKKILFLIWSLLLTFCVSKNQVYAQEASYEVNNFTEMPTGWSLYSGCDVSADEISFSNSEMTISNYGQGLNTAYYGSVYTIDQEYTNFTFEMTAKMTNPIDNNRWFGIAYHTQILSNKLVGYLMNYRYNGDSAYSAFNSVQNFWDGDKVNVGVPLNDGSYHRFKIVMNGKIAKHYVDDKLITTYDTSTRDTHFGKSLDSGKFAIIVNKSSLTIANLKIEALENNDSDVDLNKRILDETLVETYYNKENVNFPTVVFDVCDNDDLDLLKAEDVLPSNAILHLDNKMNVISKKGENLGTFEDVYHNILSKKIIPVLYLENDMVADALIRYLTEDRFILDMAIMAKDSQLIKKVKKQFPTLRGIIEYTEFTKNKVVSDANANLANVLVFPQNALTRNDIRFLHARLKTVWLKPTNADKITLYDAINSETYGLITNDFKNLYNLYSDYDVTSLTRMPFNIAHRGMAGCNECSVYGTQKAIENGATHVELDAYLTKDQKIAIIHDSTLDRVSNGIGNVEDMTLDELQQYQLDLYQPLEKIPSLADVGELFKNDEVVLVLEIKSNKLDIVDVLKKEINALGLENKMVVISFNANILKKMYEVLPAIPTALLGNIDPSANSLYTLGNHHTVANTNSANINIKSNMQFYRDRGMMGFSWTYTTEVSAQSALATGIVGITNDVSSIFKSMVESLEGIPFTLGEKDTLKNARYKLKATLYSGEEKEFTGSLFTYEEYDDYYLVICKYEDLYTGFDITTLYTQSFRVDKFQAPPQEDKPSDPIIPAEPVEPEKPSDEKKGCKGDIIISLLPISCLAIGVMF